MITNYTVVQYLPNPESGERINVGLIAWREGRIDARFVQDWTRVQRFGGENINFIRDFVRRVEAATGRPPELPLIGEGQPLNEESLKKIIGTWAHSLQFSEPRSSLDGPDQLLSQLAPLYLRSRSEPKSRVRSRAAAAAMVVHAIRACVHQLVHDPSRDLVKRSYLIKGKLDQHVFDAVVANGKPLFAAHGLSFEIGDARTLGREVDSTAWAISDVRGSLRKFPLGVLTLPPRRSAPSFDRAQRVFAGLGADVFEKPNEFERWAARMTKRTVAVND